MTRETPWWRQLARQLRNPPHLCGAIAATLSVLWAVWFLFWSGVISGGGTGGIFRWLPFVMVVPAYAVGLVVGNAMVRVRRASAVKRSPEPLSEEQLAEHGTVVTLREILQPLWQQSGYAHMYENDTPDNADGADEGPRRERRGNDASRSS